MRNLTGGNTDPYQGNYQAANSYQSLHGEEPPQNPFMSETQTLDDSSDAYSLQSENYHQNNNVYNTQYSDQPHAVGAYPPYSSSPDPNSPMMREYGAPNPPPHGMGMAFSSNNNSQLDVPSRQSSASGLGSSEFDRYPNRVSSAAPSVASGAPLLYGGAGAAAVGARGSTMSDETASSLSSQDRDVNGSNPFVVNADFSPFGGYPASSFPLHLEEKEADDYLHNPDPILDAKFDRRCQGLDRRGWAALFGLGCMLIGGILLFIVLPVLTYSGVTERNPITERVEHLTNYEYGTLSAIRTDLVDPDTPEDAKYHEARDGSKWPLVFSDEFNMEGRTFYDGDDQFWEGPDFHYAATNDLEWYSPDAITTENGTLVLTLDAYKNHDLFYRSGMLQSWNRLCFTQGYIEVSGMLPGSGKITGLWPGIWTNGNLGRPGYLATSEGVWPYSYNECDAGITPNQSSPDGISYLPGQRLNKCTCPGHDHPNEGTGRGAPEIDLLEGEISGDDDKNGMASQSLQIAPYDVWYYPNYDFIEIHNKSVTAMNTYTGGPLQQAVSAITTLNHDWYEKGDSASYQSYGYELINDDDDGYLRWFVGQEPTFTIYAPALGPNGNVGTRKISKEPMSIILNLGISNNWAYIDWPSLIWPSKFRIDYVRLYQPSDKKSLTCDPKDYPTYDYIEDHKNAYTNANLTTWEEAGYVFPPNKLTSDC
ncbi:hypothetical protein TRICI_004774 [Trichomonascus ciferrii]|uniref:GH16 domain-containing protein n=1 Tax=Trichomonascus ciferrii TaxID=44093 RepID=A0A642UZJ4_9ASCO|nr:hypothetical protein TRICI_004774 [Trichomonascus ciferrii]